jgi:hypothetical protein
MTAKHSMHWASCSRDMAEQRQLIYVSSLPEAILYSEELMIPNQTLSWWAPITSDNRTNSTKKRSRSCSAKYSSTGCHYRVRQILRRQAPIFPSTNCNMPQFWPNTGTVRKLCSIAKILSLRSHLKPGDHPTIILCLCPLWMI